MTAPDTAAHDITDALYAATETAFSPHCHGIVVEWCESHEDLIGQHWAEAAGKDFLGRVVPCVAQAAAARAQVRSSSAKISSADLVLAIEFVQPREGELNENDEPVVATVFCDPVGGG